MNSDCYTMMHTYTPYPLSRGRCVHAANIPVSQLPSIALISMELKNLSTRKKSSDNFSIVSGVRNNLIFKITVNQKWTNEVTTTKHHAGQ